MVSPPTLERPPRPKTVLIVEDNPDLRRIFADALVWAGFRDALAANTETCDIPVVIVTGTEFTWKLGSDDRVLEKPVSPSRLVATIRECLSAV